jgi:cellulose synthase/poly-beta-1,6-N-acetylglucosamine synthase-like glycosyltransferase
MLGYVIFGIYALSLFLILIYSLAQAHLTYSYLRSKKEKREIPSLPDLLPKVTVQLPIFNELYVVERLLRKVAELDYPSHLLEIQVLDDSTDECLELSRKLVDELAATGLDIKLIERPDRTGFKAGALAYGLERASGEFIAIFDADFLPPKDFLIKTLPYFQDAEIGVVQTKWEHLNQDFNVLTRLLAMALDAHFTVEQKGRNASGSFMNFNGTAGIWRKSCIDTSGGWSADTLTEDLDLSYRAQLKGWKMKYLEEFTSPAEIPAFLSAIRSQQYRWNKGGAEVARKNLVTILKSEFPFRVKFHALFHLLNTGVFIPVLVSAILSVPLLFIIADGGVSRIFLDLSAIFFTGFLLLSVFYWVSFNQHHKNPVKTIAYFLIYFPVFLSLSMGLSLFNTLAVLEGYLGIKSPFIRTPKFNIVGTETNVKKNQYLKSTLPKIALIEGLLALYFLVALWYGWQHQLYPFLPYHLLLALGFGGIFFYSVKHRVVAL